MPHSLSVSAEQASLLPPRRPRNAVALLEVFGMHDEATIDQMRYWPRTDTLDMPIG
jgi:hypothetical protein